MTTVLRSTPTPEPPTNPPVDGLPARSRPAGRWNGFSGRQLLVMFLATIGPLVIVSAVAARLAGAITTEAMVEVALGAGENPGMLTFGAMFLASPVQWWTGRTQVRVRKYLGIVFFLLALSNGAMFVVESGIGAALGAPFLVAGTVALIVALPLFATSSRWSQRLLGMARWRRLHKLTYVVAGALVGHVILIGEPGPGMLLITLGFIARTPVVRGWLVARGRTRRAAAAATDRELSPMAGSGYTNR